jgi:hypothetical protein
MRCIFCLKDRPGTEEHVFPLAIGGRVTIDRVCRLCNSTLGSRVDAALSNSFVVRARRAELGLSGSSGTPPAAYEMLVGVAKLANEPERRIQTKFNKKSGRLDIRALHHATDVIMPNGSKARQIVIDARDKDQIPKIIQRERKRHGLQPFSQEQLAAEAARCAENITCVNDPSVIFELTCDFAYVRHAMIKIAYELAFLWLGESYLDDPSAAELREAICSSDLTSTDRLSAFVGDAEGCDVFTFWPSSKTQHLAYAFPCGTGELAVAVRVFDCHAAVVSVTKDAARYLVGAGAQEKLRFLTIDAVTGRKENVPLFGELLAYATRVTRAGLESRE